MLGTCQAFTKFWSFLPALDVAQLGLIAPPHLWDLGQVGHPLGTSLPYRLNAETRCLA